MKALSFYAALLCTIFTANLSFAQTAVKKDTIKVWGNCGMCKTTIEKAAKKAGASVANWNDETKMLQVSYSPAKTSSAKIENAIAKAGYDTESVTAADEVYKKLHGCCQYERKDAVKAEKAKCCASDKCAGDDMKCKDEKCCADKTCCKS